MLHISFDQTLYGYGSRILSTLVPTLKDLHPDLNKIIYFSDGCAAQYKNRFNLINLLHHEQDFGIGAEWNFFATSHGKNACDGDRWDFEKKCNKSQSSTAYNNQILTAQDFYEHRCEKITSVKCYFVPKEEVEAAFWHHGLRMLSPSPVLKRIILFPMDANNPMSPMDANFYVPHGCEQSHVPYPSMQFQFNFISCKYLVFIFTMFSLQAIYSEMLHIYVANNSMFLMQTNSFCSWYFCKPLIPPEMMFHVTTESPKPLMQSVPLISYGCLL